MSYIESALLDDKGFVILDQQPGSRPRGMARHRVCRLEIIRSHPVRPAHERLRRGRGRGQRILNQKPPRTDKDGVWVEANAAKAPHLVERAKEPGANIGRCRVIELQPNEYSDSLYNLHQDDNNRLNPDGTGWIVRGFFNLTDDADSYFVLREERFDPTTEIRIALPAGAQVIIDTQRFWHATWHPGPEPRYNLITSWGSGPALDAYIAKYNGTNEFTDAPLDDAFVEAAQTEVQRRLAERAAALSARGKVDHGPQKSEA